jgi:hypothetical protein
MRESGGSLWGMIVPGSTLGAHLTNSSTDWGSVADWVSGIGSIFAAVVALYLARSAERIKLRGFCGLRTIYDGGVRSQDLVVISVTNVGTRATVLNNITFRAGRWGDRRYGVFPTDKDSFSVGLPYPLADGHEGHWGVALRNDREWLRELVS